MAKKLMCANTTLQQQWFQCEWHQTSNSENRTQPKKRTASVDRVINVEKSWKNTQQFNRNNKQFEF